MLRVISSNDDFSIQEYERAIVTIVIGDDYQYVWRVLSQDSWEKYGKKFGYDIIVIKEALDSSERARGRSPAWQKLLILNQEWSCSYKNIVWIDADIIISDTAFDIGLSVRNSDYVGAASHEQLSKVEQLIYFEIALKLKFDPALSSPQKALESMSDREFADFGIERNGLSEFNTGVLVLNPRTHNELFLRVYNNYNDTGLRFEQIPLSYELQMANCIQFVSARFNWNMHAVIATSHFKVMDKVNFIEFLKHELKKVYFLHFPGSMAMLKTLSRWRELEYISL
jgi:hypothetical protein